MATISWPLGGSPEGVRNPDRSRSVKGSSTPTTDLSPEFFSRDWVTPPPKTWTSRRLKSLRRGALQGLASAREDHRGARHSLAFVDSKLGEFAASWAGRSRRRRGLIFARAGDPEAAEALITLVYTELRRLAQAKMARGRHTPPPLSPLAQLPAPDPAVRISDTLDSSPPGR